MPITQLLPPHAKELSPGFHVRRSLPAAAMQAIGPFLFFDHFGPGLDREIGQRQNGVLIANSQGKALAYALFSLQERGKLMISHGDEVYEGQVVGIHSRDNDLVVNPIRTKQLTNIRAAGKDEAIDLTPPIQLTLEYAVEFIADDELVEITPKSIRLRKRFLKEHERRRAERDAA